MIYSMSIQRLSYIQIKPEYRGKVKAEEFIDYLRGRVAKYAVPKYCELVEDMALTEVQKVNKKTLRAKKIREEAV